MSLARARTQDLTAAREAVASGAIPATEQWLRCRQASHTPAAAQAYLRRFDAQAEATAQAVDRLVAAGAPVPPLAGLAVSIKDLFDVAGQPSTGGSASMADAPPAAADAPVVARLRAAGAALSGHTNLSEFAFSGVGINPHHGTPANAGTLALDPTPRVPGGSTSGGATTVAAGAAFAALGSDTGGSIRIPAALQGLVGFKNTQALTPLDACIPLSSTLDTACAVTRSVRDAVLVHEILSARHVMLTPLQPSQLHLAVATTVMLDTLEPVVARAFERSLAKLRAAGARVTEIALPALTQLATINAKGGFSAAESWAWHRERLAHRGDRYDPRVAARIRRGEAMTAADYVDLQRARRAWMAEVSAQIAPYHAIVSPTVPLAAPALAPLVASDEAFFAANAALLRNPSAVNFLDGCALSLPCQAPDELPVGLMLWAAGGADDRVLSVGLAVEALLAAEV